MIGVILMVAITVILAAVIGVFVLELGDTVQETPPTTQWDAVWVDGNVTITFVSGSDLSARNLRLIGPDGFEAKFSESGSWADAGWDDEVRAGAAASTNYSGGLPTGTYRIVWESTRSSSILKTFESPP